MLMSAGLPVPRRVYGHGFLTKDGLKMGKSLGNVLEPTALVGAYGADAVRYYFLREIVFGQVGGAQGRRVGMQGGQGAERRLRVLRQLTRSCTGTLAKLYHGLALWSQSEPSLLPCPLCHAPWSSPQQSAHPSLPPPNNRRTATSPRSASATL